MKISKYLHVEVDLTQSHGEWIEGFVSALRKDENGEIVNISIPEGYVQVTLLNGSGLIHARVGQLRPRFIRLHDVSSPALVKPVEDIRRQPRGKQNNDREAAY